MSLFKSNFFLLVTRRHKTFFLLYGQQKFFTEFLWTKNNLSGQIFVTGE